MIFQDLGNTVFRAASIAKKPALERPMQSSQLFFFFAFSKEVRILIKA